MSSPRLSDHHPLGHLMPDRIATLGENLWAEHLRSSTAINLVPSENRLSPAAQLPLRMDFYNRYFFNDSLDADGWEFRGGEAVAGLEVNHGCQALMRLARCEFVNVRPISGLNAMMIALAALGGDSGSTVVSIAPASGGHYATGGLIRRFGYRWQSVDCTAGQVDSRRLRSLLAGGRVGLVYMDLQNSLHALDLAPVLAELQAYPDTRLHVDCSHTLGLVLGGAHPNPLDCGASSMGGSTHKSFPGPQKGVLFTRDAQTAARLRDAQILLVSSHHFAETLSLAIAAVEFEAYGERYAHRVIENARALGAALSERGFDVGGPAGRYTDTHQLWVRPSNPIELSNQLARMLIRVNVQSDLPGCPGPMWRLGTSEVTMLGGEPADMDTLAETMALIRDDRLADAARLVGTLRRRLGASPHRTAVPEGAHP